MRTPLLKRCTALLMLLLYLPGCSGMQTLAGVPPAPIPKTDSALRLTLRDGTQRTLAGVTMVGDSVIGTETAFPDYLPVRAAVPWADVVKVEKQGTSGGATALLIGIVLVAMVISLKDCCKVLGTDWASGMGGATWVRP